MYINKKRPSRQRGPAQQNKQYHKLYHKNSPHKNHPKIEIKLPDPQIFYGREFPELEANCEWAKVHCCFHEDRNPSLFLNLTSGGFYCFSCEERGGDLIAFVMRRRGISFSEAIKVLAVR